MRTRRCPRTATAGRNSSTSVCAATSRRASDSRRVARYYNVFGPHGTYDGGREKAPAAICRKVIEAKLSGSGEIEIWGDGEQTRSFMFNDDCLYGTTLLMDSDVAEPINLGSAHLVTVNELVTSWRRSAGVRLRRRYNLDAPQGVRGPK
jgi:GDP-D-mannose 3',5'-epimerase